MKNITLRLLTLAMLALSASSCSKSDAPGPGPVAPREYAVEYRVSSPNASAADYVSYHNETGATTTLGTTALPATYSFKRTMKTGDGLSILASLPAGAPTSEITTLILLDGKEVKKATGRGATAQAVSVYVIGE